MYKSLKEKSNQLSPEQLTNSDSLEKILKSILAEIKSIARSKKFIDWGHSREFVQRLSHVVSNIETHLLKKSPESALKAIEAFLKISENIMEKSDDSSGNISHEFRCAVSVWGMIWNQLDNYEGKALAKSVLAYLEENHYGLYDDIISSTSDALIRNGINEFEELVKARCAAGNHQFYVYQALHDLAMIRQSPEAFLEAFKLTKKEMSVHDQLELAQLCLDTVRVDEAIILLESIQSDYLDDRRLDLLIKSYEIKNETAFAQRLKWDGFIRQKRKDLFASYYDALHGVSEKNQAVEQATHIALTWETLPAIAMLFELKQFDIAADFLLQRYDSLEGHQYYVLQDFAQEFKKNKFYLEAILIYRRLSEETISRAQSKYYHHAINYLGKELQISQHIKDWKQFPATDDYFNQLRQKHRLKTSFMKQFESI